MGSKGFFTDTTVCIGCKACEVACKQWNQLPDDGLVFTARSYDNTGDLGSTTWRHVAFVEQADARGGVAWKMMSDVCKHCERAGCLEACPNYGPQSPFIVSRAVRSGIGPSSPAICAMLPLNGVYTVSGFSIENDHGPLV